MSNHPTLPQPDTEPDLKTASAQDETTDKKQKLELSLTQVVGGALAAMTAAALGSTLGVAGTVAGAALASVIAGVAGALYTASLRSGRERVKTVFRGRSPQATAILPPPVPVEAAPATDPSAASPRGPFPWRRAVGVTVAVFALAALLLTGYELLTGQAISGGKGTTVSQVRQAAEPAPTQAKPTAAESTPTPTPSTQTPAPGGAQTAAPSQSAASEPTPSAPSTPTLTPTPTASPSQ